MPSFTIALKDLRLLLRDPRSAVILLLMPLVLILVLGLSLGDAFGRKQDDQLQISVVVEDVGLPEMLVIRPPTKEKSAGALLGSMSFAAPMQRKHPPTKRWVDVLLDDLKDTGNIKIEVIPSRAEAEQLVKRGKRSAVIVFEPEFSDRVDRCSFVGSEFRPNPINPLDRYGVVTREVGVTVLDNPYQPIGGSVVKQVTQVSLMRVIVPWMIGQAFDLIGTPLFMKKMEGYIPGFSFLPTEMRAGIGLGIRKGIGGFFGNYDFTALTWYGLTKDIPPDVKAANAAEYAPPPTGLGRGAKKYQILVPSYTVTFAFFLVLTVGWLFVAERRHGTMVRLRAAPITRGQILLGKLLPCFAVSAIQGFTLLLFGKLIFGMRFGSEPWLIVPVVLSTSFAAVGLAMFVAGLARTETQVAVYGTLLVLVLAGLSGSMMPRELMPEWMRSFSYVTPHAWALDAYEQLLHPESPAIDFATVGTSCGILCGFGLGFTLLAWWWMNLE